ncbi:MAG TPA: 2Fe-2S iron-sulfur cluster binding domain-containing protein [Pseudonocardiaceae bacterium]
MTAIDDQADFTPTRTGAQARIEFPDGAAREFAVRPGQTVLAAAADAGINLVSQCQVGTCGTCVARLTSGTAEMLTGQAGALNSDEIADGQRLLCRTRLGGDACFVTDYPSALTEANPAQLFRTKIQKLDWVAASVVELTLRVPKSVRFTFSAGQYCRVQVPGTGEWRSYSMASGEHERFRLTFLIRVLETGAMSDYLRKRARVGDLLPVEGPRGGFVLDPAARPAVLMAGGTGLAPMLSMIDRIRLLRPPPPTLLLFGCAKAEDLFYLEELAARQGFTPNLRIRTALDDNSGNLAVPAGNPVSALLPEDITPETVAYLCGPPGMLRAAEQRLTELGVSPHDIRSEQFVDSSN